jgi:peptidoglycan/xylan/chitin deacetylase (PgdA/CDA1 family)
VRLGPEHRRAVQETHQESAPAVARRPLTCLTYHHFAVEPCATTRPLGITTDPRVLKAQLDHVQHHYSVIGLDRLIAGDIPDRAALITFDDAYRSVYEVAAPELRARRLPGVMFANPGPIAGAVVPFELVASYAIQAVGADEVARVASAGAAAARSLGQLMREYVSHLGLADLRRARERLVHRLGTTEAELHRRLDLFMAPDQLRHLPTFGIEVANHTLTHVHCRWLDDAELETEIVGSKRLLEDLLGATGQPVRAFAFPWGGHQDATERALGVVRRSGHQATFLMYGLRNTRRPAPDLWYRILMTSQESSKLWLTLEAAPRLRELRARLSLDCGRSGARSRSRDETRRPAGPGRTSG